MAWAASEERFWDKHDSSAWNAEQVKQFETASPWAKQTTALLTSNDSNSGVGLGTGLGDASAPTRSAGGTITNRGRVYSSHDSNSPNGPALPRFSAIVRWQNAPMQKLLKPKLPEGFKGHYVISVSGLPIGEDAPSLAERTTLQIKRNDPIHPEIAYQDPTDTATVYFAFLPSTLDPFSAKVAEFKMDAAPFEVRIKFNLSEMKIHGDPSF